MTRWMALLAITGLLASFGCDRPDEAAAAPDAGPPPTITCYSDPCVREFQKGYGIPGRDGEAAVEFCSDGCSELFELDPEYYRPR